MRWDQVFFPEKKSNMATRRSEKDEGREGRVRIDWWFLSFLSFFCTAVTRGDPTTTNQNKRNTQHNTHQIQG